MSLASEPKVSPCADPVHGESGAAGDDRIDVAARSEDGVAFLAQFTVVEQRGSQRFALEGSCQIILRQQDAAGSRTLECVDGQWRGPLAVATYQVAAVYWRDALCDLVEVAEVSPAAPRSEIFVRARDAWQLSVVDARTRAHLRNVTVLVLRPSSASDVIAFLGGDPDRDPPRDGVALAAEHADSPVELAEPRAGACYWTHAPGYAWRAFARSPSQRHIAIALDEIGAAEFHVAELPREVLDELAGDDATAPLVLEVRPQQGSPRTQELFGGERTLIPRLSVGECQASVRWRTTMGVGAIAWSGSFDVSAAETTRVNVELENQASKRGDARLVVTALLPDKSVRPSDWTASLWRFDDALGGLREVGGRAVNTWSVVDPGRVFSMTCSRLEPGEYVVRLVPGDVRQHVVLPSATETEVVLDARQCARVHVRAVAPAETGDTIVCSWGYLNDHRAWAASEASFEAARSISLWCRPEPIWIEIHTQSAASPRVTVLPDPWNEQEVALSLAPSEWPRVRVDAWQSGSRAFVDESFWRRVSIANTSGQDAVRLRTFGLSDSLVSFGAGVRYPDWSQCTFTLESAGGHVLRLWEREHNQGRCLRELAFDAPSGSSEIYLDLARP